VTTTVLPTAGRPTTMAVPAPRPAVETQRTRRQRPATQYWDVFEACWRSARER